MVTYEDLQQAIDDEAGIVPCQNAPDFFFPPEHLKRANATHYKNARKLCSQCPIQLTCLQYAIDNGETHGMWGGLTPQERHAQRKRRDRQTTW